LQFDSVEIGCRPREERDGGCGGRMAIETGEGYPPAQFLDGVYNQHGPKHFPLFMGIDLWGWWWGSILLKAFDYLLIRLCFALLEFVICFIPMVFGAFVECE